MEEASAPSTRALPRRCSLRGLPASPGTPERYRLREPSARPSRAHFRQRPGRARPAPRTRDSSEFSREAAGARGAARQAPECTAHTCARAAPLPRHRGKIPKTSKPKANTRQSQIFKPQVPGGGFLSATAQTAEAAPARTTR